MKLIFTAVMTISTLVAFSQTPIREPISLDTLVDPLINLQQIDPENVQKALVDANGIIYINASIGMEYRIFGYKEMDVSSKKMILISHFQNEVEGNPMDCTYGAYYDFRSTKKEGLRLNYLAIDGDFVKIDVLAKNMEGDGYLTDEIYMLKEWFEFEE